MHVFGHEHEGGQLDSRLLAGYVDAPSQPLPPLVVSEQGQTVVTGEGQFVQIARLVIVFDELSMGTDVSHGQQLKTL